MSTCTPDRPYLPFAILLPVAAYGSVIGDWVQYHVTGAVPDWRDVHEDMRREVEENVFQTWHVKVEHDGWTTWSEAMRRPIGMFLTGGTVATFIALAGACYAQMAVQGIIIFMAIDLACVMWTEWRNTEHHVPAGRLMLLGFFAAILLTFSTLIYQYETAVWLSLFILNCLMAALFLGHPITSTLAQKHFARDTNLLRMAQIATRKTLIAAELANVTVFAVQLYLARGA